jgi:ribosome-binding factor A
MNRRAAQVASEMQKAIQTILDRGLQDPRLAEALLTVTDVRVSDDLRNATVMVSIMPGERENLAMHGLKAAARHIRRQVSNLMEIRQLPEFAFKLDKSAKKQAEVLGAIARVTAEREAAEARQAEQAAEPGDARLDSGPDAGPDAGPEPGSEPGPGAGPETRSDQGSVSWRPREAGPDSRPA